MSNWRVRVIAVAIATGLISACSDAPDARVPTAPSPQLSAAVSVRQTAVDSVARAIALAMQNQVIRSQLKDDFRDSPFPFHALELSSYLRGNRGEVMAQAAARAAGISQSEFLALISSMPSMLIKVERPLDRVRWAATADVVVYGSTTSGTARVRNTPTVTGFNIRGAAVPVPLWTAGSAPYLVIMPTDIAFGNSPEQVRAAAPSQPRAAISTVEEEMRATMSPAALAHANSGGVQLMTMPLPCDPNTDPNCSSGGGGGYDTDGTRLPALYTAGYCFGWTSWGVPPLDASNDKDADGIRDDCEYQLAYAFRPMLARNNADDAPEKEPYWSVTRDPGTNGVTGIKIFYALSYYRDAGDPVDHTSAHDGDSEFIIVNIQNDMNPSDYSLWELNQATLSAHWMAGYGTDHTATYAGSDLEYPSAYRGRPRIWVSWDKHANYRSSKSVCQATWTDTCDTMTTGTVYDDLDVQPDANVGNYFDIQSPTTSRRLMDCVSSRHPGMGRAGYGIECYWEDSRDFLGWNDDYGQAGATPYRTMFQYYSF